MESPLGLLSEDEMALIFEKIEPFLPINDFEVPVNNVYDSNFQNSEGDLISDSSNSDSASPTSKQSLVSKK